MAVRRDILNDVAARDAFIQAVLALDQEFPGTTTEDLGIDGPSTELSLWDLFTLWHYYTMNIATPDGSSRNAAHRGPVFLPWHRWLLLLLELHMQRVLGDPDFGLPYWDWAADGDLPASEQTRSDLWSDDVLGGDGFPLTTGPFAFDPNDSTSFRVRVWESVVSGRLEATNRSLWRQLGENVPTLPTTAHVEDALDLSLFDRSPFDVSSGGLRNRLEGWTGAAGPGLHNRVHVWVGGDMGPGTSPNDPVFYLNHCNVDRLWEAWMLENGRTYRPEDDEPDDLFRHRLGDPLVSMLTDFEPRVEDMLDVSELYTYDVLP